MRRAALLAGVLAVVSTGAALAQEQASFEDLAFMSGCRQGQAGNGLVMEEIFTAPSKNLMLGVTRFLREGRAVQYEFIRIQASEEGIVMTPYPNGRVSEHGFKLTSADGASAVFEAPEHDYPKRILYRKNPDGTLTARIDAGETDPGGQTWKLSPAPCPTSG